MALLLSLVALRGHDCPPSMFIELVNALREERPFEWL